MNTVSRIIFIASMVAAAAFFLIDGGYLFAECRVCNAAGTNGFVALAGVVGYGFAIILPKEWLTRTAIVFAAAHALLVFSQWRFGGFCWFCTAIFVVALCHALLRLSREPAGWRLLPTGAAAGVLAGTALLFGISHIYAQEIPNEVLSTETYFVEKAPLDPGSPVEDSSPQVEEGPILVQAYVRETCGYCREFKNVTMPALLAMPDLPPFTVQYISAPKGRSVPYFEIQGTERTAIRGLTSPERFAEALRDCARR